MKLIKRKHAEVEEPDMTAMVDMTFQLIVIFMVMINFSDMEQDQRVNLPASELAIPPESSYDEPLTIQMTADNLILFGGQDMDIEGLRAAIRLEATLLKAYEDNRISDATVVIRADYRCQTGKVQEVIGICQEEGFDQFALRGQQSHTPTLGTE